eukprot:tig00000881_g5231.t2
MRIDVNCDPDLFNMLKNPKVVKVAPMTVNALRSALDTGGSSYQLLYDDIYKNVHGRGFAKETRVNVSVPVGIQNELKLVRTTVGNLEDFMKHLTEGYEIAQAVGRKSSAGQPQDRGAQRNAPPDYLEDPLLEIQESELGIPKERAAALWPIDKAIVLLPFPSESSTLELESKVNIMIMIELYFYGKSTSRGFDVTLEFGNLPAGEATLVGRSVEAIADSFKVGENINSALIRELLSLQPKSYTSPIDITTRVKVLKAVASTLNEIVSASSTMQIWLRAAFEFAAEAFIAWHTSADRGQNRCKLAQAIVKLKEDANWQELVKLAYPNKRARDDFDSDSAYNEIRKEGGQALRLLAGPLAQRMAGIIFTSLARRTQFLKLMTPAHQLIILYVIEFALKESLQLRQLQIMKDWSNPFHRLADNPDLLSTAKIFEHLWSDEAPPGDAADAQAKKIAKRTTEKVKRVTAASKKGMAALQFMAGVAADAGVARSLFLVSGLGCDTVPSVDWYNARAEPSMQVTHPVGRPRSPIYQGINPAIVERARNRAYQFAVRAFDIMKNILAAEQRRREKWDEMEDADRKAHENDFNKAAAGILIYIRQERHRGGGVERVELRCSGPAVNFAVAPGTMPHCGHGIQTFILDQEPTAEATDAQRADLERRKNLVMSALATFDWDHSFVRVEHLAKTAAKIVMKARGRAATGDNASAADSVLSMEVAFKTHIDIEQFNKVLYSPTFGHFRCQACHSRVPWRCLHWEARGRAFLERPRPGQPAPHRDEEATRAFVLACQESRQPEQGPAAPAIVQ